MTEHEYSRLHRRRQGQTLVEFALTLPILLLLVFGVIEFGRIFQAWVTIQNAAREATRYTTTGQYDQEKYDLEALLPCTNDDAEDAPSSPSIFNLGGVDVISYGASSPENLFATYYDGINCDAGSPDHLEWRKDILRLASIYDVARRGAAGLSLEPSTREATLGSLYAQLANNWASPMPRSTQPRYFNVTVCSTRPYIHQGKRFPYDDRSNTRFYMVLDNDDRPVGYPYPFEAPFCMFNEVPADESVDPPVPAATGHNGGMPWMDAGGPGDRVTVVVTFNHPLITPLPLADFLKIESRRSGVNETFRTARALNALQSGPVQLSDVLRNTPIPPTATDTFTPVPPTQPATAYYTDTPTDKPATPEPFSCDRLFIGDLALGTNSMSFRIYNSNYQAPMLKSVHLYWAKPLDSPSMYLQDSALNSMIHWDGIRDSSPFVLADPVADAQSNLTAGEVNRWNTADLLVPGEELTGQVTSRSLYRARFANTSSLATLDWSDFGGTKVVFAYPGDADCVKELPLDPDEPYGPPPPDDNDDTFTPTFTPDCASDSLRVSFDAFETFGVVRLKVENSRNRPSPMFGFDLFWFDSDPDPEVGPDNVVSAIYVGGGLIAQTGLYMADIWVGPPGSGMGGPGSVKVWQGPDYLSQTANYPGGPQEGTWLRNYDFQPNSVNYIYLNFDGTGNRLDSQYGYQQWMLNGFFYIDCTLPDGTSGRGVGGDESGRPYFDSPIPNRSATPENTATNTPITPTNTATDTPIPPTPTWTFTPSRTPLPTDTPVATPTTLATLDIGGGGPGDGGVGGG